MECRRIAFRIAQPQGFVSPLIFSEFRNNRFGHELIVLEVVVFGNTIVAAFYPPVRRVECNRRILER